MTVVVIGGGVIGLCISLTLARRGVIVTVIDSGTPASGASAANAGWITPSLAGPLPEPGLTGTSLRWLLRPDTPLRVRPRVDPAFVAWLFRFWRHMNLNDYRAGLEATLELASGTMELFDALARSGLPFEMHADGILMAYSSLRAYQTGLIEANSLSAYGYAPLKVATGEAVRDLEPALGAGIAGAFIVAGERHVDPVSFGSALLAELRVLGVEILAPVPITHFSIRGTKVVAVQTTTSSVTADVVVIAAGVSTARLTSNLGCALPIESGKGYAVDVAPPPLRLERPVYLHDERVAMTPLSSRLRLAGTMELGGRANSISMTRVRAIEASARRLLVGWPQGTGSTTYLSGLRPVTPDGLPVIGPLPGFENVWVASGHAMLGLTLAPATAEAIADGVMSGRVPPVVVPFLPARFVTTQWSRRGKHRTVRSASRPTRN